MESIKTAISLVSRTTWMGVVDLTVAYHGIHIHSSHHKYFKFRHRDQLYSFTCVPFGLCIAPWLYTTLNKPVISFLRRKGVVLVSYLDDNLLIAQTLI